MPNNDTTPDELNKANEVEPKKEVLDRDDVVEGILKRFSFESVHTSMEATGHKWTLLTDGASTSEKPTPNTKTVLPTVEEIREVGMDLLTQLINDITGLSMVGQGGLEAYKHENSIGLRFVVYDLEATWESVDNG